MNRIRINPTEYTVCGLPEDDINAQVWRITIEWRGPESWAVCHMSRCLNRQGEWDYEPLPSSRTDEWIAEHRFTFGLAKAAAIHVYPHLVINGLRVVDGKLTQG